LKEEMGFTTQLEKIFDFVYKAEFDNGLAEYEFDHVFAGKYDGTIDFNKEEVMDYCFKNLRDVSDSLQEHTEKYTKWFRIAFPRVEDWWQRSPKTMSA